MNRPTQKSRTRVARRRFLRTTLAGGVLAGLAACATPSNSPSITVQYPTPGARVTETTFPVRVKLRNFARTRAEEATKPSNVYVLVDTPPDALADGQPLPPDEPGKVLQTGATDILEIMLTLTPGVHTLTVLLADGNRMRLPNVAPVSMSVLVQPGSNQPQ